MINPLRTSDDVVIDKRQSVNGNDLIYWSKFTVGVFKTLDQHTVREMSQGLSDSRRFGLRRAWLLPDSQPSYHRWVREEKIEELYGKRIVEIAMTSDHYSILLSCDDLLRDKVLLKDHTILAEQPFDNFAILADSFDDFLRSIYCE